MQDEVIDNVVEYVDRLRNYTTTNISSIQAGMIPEILDIHWKVSPYYLDNGVKRYVFGKKEYVIQISGLRFKNNLPKRKNLVFKMPFQEAVNKGFANPSIFFVNRHFIRWSDITLVRDLKYTYLDIKNHFDVSIIDPIKITDVQVIHIPFNVSYTEKRNPLTAKEIFRFDSRSGKLLEYGDCVYYTTLEDVEYKQFHNLVGAVIKDADLDFNKLYKLTPVNFLCWEDGFISPAIKPTIKNLNLITFNDGDPLQYDTTVKFFYRNVTNHNRSNITIPPNDGVLKQAIIDNDRPQLDIVTMEKDFDFKYRQDMLYKENFNAGVRYIARYNDAFFDELYQRKCNIRTCFYEGNDIKKLIRQRQKLIKAHDERKIVTERIVDHEEKVITDDVFRDANALKEFTYYYKYNPESYLLRNANYTGETTSKFKKVSAIPIGSKVFDINNPYNMSYKKLATGFEFKLVCISRNRTDLTRPAIPTGATTNQKRLVTKLRLDDKVRSQMKTFLNNDTDFLVSLSDTTRAITLKLVSENENIDIFINKNELLRMLANDEDFAFIEIDDKNSLPYPKELIMFPENEIYSAEDYLGEFNFNSVFNTIDYTNALSNGEEITGPYKITKVYKTVDREVVTHYDDMLTAPDLVMPSGLHDRLDGYVMIFKNGELWDKYDRIRYEKDNFVIPLTQEEVDEIEEYDDFEVIHFDRCNNNYLTVDVTEDNNEIENTTIPYNDLIVLATFNKRHIYYDYLKFTQRSVYDVPFKIDEAKKKIIFTDSDYYGKTIYMASNRQFHYCFYKVEEPQVQFYLTKEFCCAKDKDRYMVFINGRMISKNMYHLIIQDPDNSVTEPVIHSRILCKAGDKIEIFYIPEQPKFLNIGGNNKASIVNVKATSDGQAVFAIPIPTRKYNITKDNFFLMKGSVIVEQERYNVIGTNVIFKEREDYLEYGHELTFVFLYNELIEENPYGAIKEEDMLTVNVTTTYADTDVQTTFPIIYPYEGFDTSKAMMFVTYRGLFVNPRRYDVIERNHTITFKDPAIGIDVGTAVSYVWIYPTEKHKLDSYIVRAEATIDNQTQFNIPVPYANYFKDQNKFLVTRNGIFLNDSDYSIDKNRNILTLTSIDGLSIGQELVFTFFTGKELSVKTQQIMVTATEDNQMVFQVPEMFHDVKNIYSKFFIVIGDTFIDPRRYEITGTTIRFLNDDDAMPAGKSFFFTFTYTEEIDSATAIIGDVHDGSKYTNMTSYSVDATKDGQMTFDIPVENAAIYNKQFFVTVGSTFINETNYKLDKLRNKLTFIDGTVDIKAGRHVYFTFIDSEYAVIEKDVRVAVAQADGQLEIEIPVPFENFFELGNNCLVYINNVYFDPSRYTIQNNTLSIKDESDGLIAGEDVVFMFLYVSNNYNTSYKEDDVQMPKLTEYGFIYLSNKEIRHSMNTGLFFLFINGKKIEKNDILIIANNIIRITKDPATNFNPVIMDFTPSIPELDKYKQITSDFDLIMNKCTKDDINDMYNEYTTVTDIESHIVPNTSQEAIINNIILNHYVANGISFGKPFVYTYDTNTINRTNFVDMQNITHRFIEPGWYDFTVPKNVNMLIINSISSSSVADLTNESNLAANKTNVNLPNGNYIIPQSLRIQFRNIDKVLYSVSNGHNKGYSAVEAGVNNAFTPMPGNYGIPEDTTKFRGRYMVKTMRVLPGSKYRVTVANKGFVKIGYYTDGTDVEINYDDATDQYQNYSYKINGNLKDVLTTLTPAYVQDFTNAGQYEFTVPTNVTKIIVAMCSGFEKVKTLMGDAIEIPMISAVQLASYNEIDFALPDIPTMSTEENLPVRELIKRINGVNKYDITKYDHEVDGMEINPYSNGDKFGNAFYQVNTIKKSDQYVLIEHELRSDYAEQFTRLVQNGLMISVAKPSTGTYQTKSIMVNPGDIISVYVDKSYDSRVNTSGAITITYKNLQTIEEKDFYVMNTMDATKYAHPELDFTKDNDLEIKKDEIDQSASTDAPGEEAILDKDHPTFVGSDRPTPLESLDTTETLFVHTKKDAVE